MWGTALASRASGLGRTPLDRIQSRQPYEVQQPYLATSIRAYQLIMSAPSDYVLLSVSANPTSLFHESPPFVFFLSISQSLSLIDLVSSTARSTLPAPLSYRALP